MHLDKLSIVSFVKLCFIGILLTACTNVPFQAGSDKYIRSLPVQVNEAWSIKTPVTQETVPWIKSFGDSDLEGIVLEALANNLNLQASSASLESAYALAAQAGAALKPNVNLAFETNRIANVKHNSLTSNTQNLGLGVSWEADIWGRISTGKRSALASAQAAEADFRFAQYSLAASTIIAYITIIDAKTQTDIANESLGILKETLRVVDVRLQNGIGSAQDLALAKSDLALAREQIVTSEGAKRDSLRALEILLGRYPDASFMVNNQLPNTPVLPSSGIPSELLERRPDVIASERRVAAAFNRLQQSKAARLPSFSLNSNIGGASNSLSAILDPANVAWQLGSSLLAPVFDGGVRKAEVKIAKAEQKQALSAYAQASLNAFAEVERLLDQGFIIKEREVQLTEAEREAAKAYQIAKLRYDVGETDLLELLSIQQRLISAKSNLASVRRLLLEQRVNLNLALGGGWD